MAGKKKRFIQKAIKKPGSLRSAAGVKKGQKIPLSTARRLAKSKGKTGQRARFYLNVLRKAGRRKR